MRLEPGAELRLAPQPLQPGDELRTTQQHLTGFLVVLLTPPSSICGSEMTASPVCPTTTYASDVLSGSTSQAGRGRLLATTPDDPLTR